MRWSLTAASADQLASRTLLVGTTSRRLWLLTQSGIVSGHYGDKGNNHPAAQALRAGLVCNSVLGSVWHLVVCNSLCQKPYPRSDCH